MRSYKFLFKTAIGAIAALSLVMATGCPETNSDAKDQPTVTKRVPPPPPGPSLQTIFDEAAKGAKADLKKLSKQYKEKAEDQADQIAELNKKTTEDGDNFVCLVSKLPMTSDVFAIFDNVINKLPDSKEAVEVDCSGNSKVVDNLLDKKRPTGDSKVGDAISLVIEKADDSMVERVDDAKKLAKVLDSVKGKQSVYAKVAKVAHVKFRAEVEDHAAKNRTPEVKAAMVDAGLVSDALLLAELAKSSPDAAKVKLHFEGAIDDAAKAAALAGQPATGAKFAQLLAKLPANADTLAVWTQFLDFIATNAGAAAGAAQTATAAQVNLASAGVASPIKAYLTAAESVPPGSAVPDDLQSIIALLVAKGDVSTVRVANDPAKLKIMLDAVAQKQSSALAATFGHVNRTVDGTPLVRAHDKWVAENRSADVDAAFAAIATPAMVAKRTVEARMAHVANPGVPATEEAIKTAKMFYETGVRGDVAKINTLKTHVVPAIGAAPANGVFAHNLAALPPDAELVSIWDDFLTKVNEHAVAAAGGVAAGPGAVAAGKGAERDQAILLGVGLILMPVNAVAAQPDAFEDARNQILKRMAVADIGPVIAGLAGANVDHFLTAMRKEETAANFLAAIRAAHAPATHPDPTMAWLGTNLNEALPRVAGAPNTVLDVLKGQVASIDDAAVLTEAAKGFGPGNADVDKLSVLYKIAIDTDAKADALSKAAAAGETFHGHLSTLEAVPKTLDIWKDYLRRIQNNVDAGLAGATTVVVVLNTASGAGTIAAREILKVGRVAAARDNPDSIAELVTLAVNRGNDATIAILNGSGRVNKALNAVMAKGKEPDLQKIFAFIPNAQLADLGTWVGNNISRHIRNLADNADVKITTLVGRENTRALVAPPVAPPNGLVRNAAQLETLRMAILSTIYRAGSSKAILEARASIDDVNEPIRAAIARVIAGGLVSTVNAELDVIINDMNANNRDGLAALGAAGGLGAGVAAAIGPVLGSQAIENAGSVLSNPDAAADMAAVRGLYAEQDVANKTFASIAGAAVNKPLAKLLYFLVITTDAKANTLRGLPVVGAVHVNDRFALWLSQLTVDAHIRQIWIDFLDKIENHDGTAVGQVKLAPGGAGNHVFREIVRDGRPAGDDPEELKRVIGYMAEYADDDATVRFAGTAREVTRLMESVLDYGYSLGLSQVFIHASSARNTQIARALMKNPLATIRNSGGGADISVKSVISAAYAAGVGGGHPDRMLARYHALTEQAYLLGGEKVLRDAKAAVAAGHAAAAAPGGNELAIAIAGVAAVGGSVNVEAEIDKVINALAGNANDAMASVGAAVALTAGVGAVMGEPIVKGSVKASKNIIDFVPTDVLLAINNQAFALANPAKVAYAVLAKAADDMGGAANLTEAIVSGVGAEKVDSFLAALKGKWPNPAVAFIDANGQTWLQYMTNADNLTGAGLQSISVDLITPAAGANLNAWALLP